MRLLVIILYATRKQFKGLRTGGLCPVWPGLYRFGCYLSVTPSIIATAVEVKEYTPDATCLRSPETASFFPPRRSSVPSAYPFALAASTSASPVACSCLPARCMTLRQPRHRRSRQSCL